MIRTAFNHLKSFRALKKKYRSGKGNFIDFILINRLYGATVDDYFKYELYSRSSSFITYIQSTNKYKRRWATVSKKCASDKNKLWIFVHHVDFLLARLLYSGLDASDYFHYEFYNFRYSKRKSFITEGGLKKMDSAFNGKADKSVLTDKAKFNDYFSKYISRKWISSATFSDENFKKFSDSLKQVIVKPNDGFQGRGIFIIDITTPDQRKQFLSLLTAGNYIAEELVVQHPAMDKLNPASVNTIRVYSVEKDNKIYITGAVLRIGNGILPTDNYSAGGMAATIDVDTGLVISSAIDKDNNRYFVHPVTGHTIIGFQVPEWKSVLCTVKDAHLMLPELRYIAWDVVVTASRQVTFLEGNTAGGVGLQQHPMLTGKKELYCSLL